MIRVNANLFRITALTQSTEETRYYLCGVHVEPHPVIGAFLVTTDGHRMTVVHDESAHVEAAAVIRLSADALKLCKAKHGVELREIEVDATTKVATIYCGRPRSDEKITLAEHRSTDLSRKPVGISPDCVVDGTFPDWRRVVPRVDFDKPVSTCFDGHYLADFAKIGAELGAPIAFADRSPKRRSTSTTSITAGKGMTVFSSDAGAPALIRWAQIDHAFGVLMPMRGDVADSLPPWLNAKAPQAEPIAA